MDIMILKWYRKKIIIIINVIFKIQDIWGIGTVMFELISLFPLFPGNDELDQIHRIHNILGTPDPKLLEKF